MKKLAANIIFFSVLMLFSSAWALAKMGSNDPPSVFHYTWFYLCSMMIAGGFLITVKVWGYYGFFIPENRGKNLLKINFGITALLGLLFSTMQANILACTGRHIDYLAPMYSYVNGNTAILFFLVIILGSCCFYFCSEVVGIKRNGHTFQTRTYLFLFLSNLIFSFFLALSVGAISGFTHIYSGAPLVYFPIGNFCRI